MKNNPRLDQGNFSRTNQLSRYLNLSLFEGWYHKVYIPDLHLTVLVIFGYMEYKKNKSAFIQIASSKDLFSAIHYFPAEALVVKENEVSILEHRFTAHSLSLHLPDFAISLKTAKKSSSITSPYQSAIGAKKFIPFVNCKHEILTSQHSACVTLSMKEMEYSGEATHYLETSWGNEFPSEYHWLQANSFDVPNTSFLFAHGKPSFIGIKSQQFLGHLKLENETYHFNNRSTKVRIDSSSKRIELQHKKSTILVSYGNGFPLSLLAPYKGSLDHPVIEHLNAPLSIQVIKNNQKQLFKSTSASWEHQ